MLVFTASVPSVFAQGADSSDPPAQTLTQEQKDTIQNLIDKLENEDQRKALVGDLKVLLTEQEKQAAEDNMSLTESIGVRGQIGQAVAGYEEFLEKNNLSSSVVHQSVGTGVVLLVAIGFFFGVGTLSRKILKTVDRLSQKIGLRLTRFGIYTKVLQLVLKLLIGGLTIYTIGKIWSISSIDAVFESDQMRQLISTFVTVLFVAFFAAVIWESIGVGLTYILQQADHQNKTRMKTLLPIARNVILIVVAILFGLVLLSELGINVTPLLAGAGVIGVAVGFGAQNMVKDFLTGFTIVLEDLVRVGDVVTVSDCTGVVEQITLRKIQLRDVAGIVYTIPFSEITTIQNLTKDFSYYVMNIGVTYNVDTDKVVEVLGQVDEDLRKDTEYGAFVLEPLEILGVDQFADSAVVIKARIKTPPSKQWFVGREFNRRMKHAFDKAGIEIPFPQRTVTVVSQSPDAASIALPAGQIAAD